MTDDADGFVSFAGLVRQVKQQGSTMLLNSFLVEIFDRRCNNTYKLPCIVKKR